MHIKSLIICAVLLSSLRCIKHCRFRNDFNNEYKDFISPQGFIESYEAGSLLGEGSFGVVRLTPWDKGTAAVKKVSRPTAKGDIFLLEQELSFLERMAKKGASVEFFGCLERGTNVYIVQESLFSDLGSDEVKITLMSLSVPDRLRKFRDIAMKISRLHDNLITHQDIKPENIMAVDKNLDEFRIIDFGLSEEIGKNVYGGSLFYMSPDKIKGIVKAEVYHDIYAFALTLAALVEKPGCRLSPLIEGCYKPNRDDSCEEAQKELVEKFFKCSQIPELYKIVLTGIAPKGAYPYSSMERMADAIEKLAKRLDTKPSQTQTAIVNAELEQEKHHLRRIVRMRNGEERKYEPRNQRFNRKNENKPQNPLRRVKSDPDFLQKLKFIKNVPFTEEKAQMNLLKEKINPII